MNPFSALNPLAGWGLLLSHAVVACVSAALYGEWLGARYEARIATTATTHATEKQHAAEAATLQLTTAQTRGDALTTALLAAEAARATLLQEKRHAVAQNTTGRPCLGEPALRLLNSAPGLYVSGLPSPTTAASSAAAAGERIATDTDITGWAIDAGAQYGVCKDRLDALIDFLTPSPVNKP